LGNPELVGVAHFLDIWLVSVQLTARP
jgi:hypothetical protein